MSKVDRVKSQLNVVKADLTNQFKKTKATRDSSTSAMLRQLSSKNYPKAYECLTMICSSFDKESALNYVLESTKNIQSDISTVIESRVCPPNLASDVAALCYAAKQGYFKTVTDFVNSFFVSQWGKNEVNILAESSLVPRELSKLKRPEAYTLEELHFFAQECERTLHIDMTWFFDNYPINKERPPETKVDVSIGGKSISSTTIQQPVAKPNFGKSNTASVFTSLTKSKSKSADPLPGPKQFKVEDFLDIQDDISKILKKWVDYDL